MLASNNQFQTQRTPSTQAFTHALADLVVVAVLI